MTSHTSRVAKKPSTRTPWPDHVAPALLLQTPPLEWRFYERSALTVAKDLLGKVLVTGSGRNLAAGLIIEVEAYLGADDPASHAFRGKTARNSSMFSGGGIAYVYLSYGMHLCVNIVTGREGEGEAVLLRTLWPLSSQELMAKRRGLVFSPTPKVLGNLASGPGKLTQALAIALEDNGRPWDQPDFKIIDLGYRPRPSEIMSSPRIGITKGVELPWRYFIDGLKIPIPKAKLSASSK